MYVDIVSISDRIRQWETRWIAVLRENAKICENVAVERMTTEYALNAAEIEILGFAIVGVAKPG